MTVRNLEYLFRPSSVALIGASRRSQSVGAVVARNLLRAGFDGPIMPVNPRHPAVEGVLTYPDVASLPRTPDLAVIATPPASVPGLVAELASRGTRGIVVITAGFGAGGDEEGARLRQEMLDAARPHLARIIGPNCLGIMVPGVGLNAGFAHIDPRPGKMAFVAQSGAIVTSVLDWATDRGVGFSQLISLGDMADVDFGDMLDYLASDLETSAILLYIEAVQHPRKFLSAARAAARSKPVIVVKGGRHEEGARAAASHTGAMAGSDAVYDAAIRRAGMLRVGSLEELFAAVETLANLRPPKGDRLAILTNGGGLGVMATDDLMDADGSLAAFSPETIQALDEVLPSTWSRANPVDIIGDAPGKRYEDALRIIAKDQGVDAVLVLNCPTAVASSTEAARSVISAARELRDTVILTSWLGSEAAHKARRLFADRGIPTYFTPRQAVQAFMHLVEYRRNQVMLMETPPSIPEAFTPDVERARQIFSRALEEGREWLTEGEAKEVLVAYGIPVAATLVAATPEEAAERGKEIPGPVVLKILSPDITHKSDVGGVVLGLENERAVRGAARAMLETVREAYPDAEISGFTVQPYIDRPDGWELIVGATEDALFGPTILFGQGGTAVEIIGDRALALPPLNMHLAQELMRRTRIYRLLKGFRGHAPADLDAVALTLVKVSQLVADHRQLAELDINPLLADAEGVMALDARIRVAPESRHGTHRLAIRPYPKELEEVVTLGDGRELIVRPVLPEDEPMFQETFAKLTPEEVRLRFFAPVKALSHVAAARFTQLDFNREMALVVAAPGPPGKAEIFGVVSLAADPDNERGEYALLVRGEMTGMGLGIFLMRRIIDYAKGREIGEIWGDVLRDNRTMLKLCRILGFVEERIPDEPTLVRVRLNLAS